MAGYSNTPLAKKLGIEAGYRVKTKNAPVDFRALVEPLPPEVTVSARLRRDVDIFHLFTSSRAELALCLPRCRDAITRDGMIWVSWPKRASGVATDVTEDTIREVALPLGLVDVKVCAVDAICSGLKLVVPKALRVRLSRSRAAL